MKTNQTLLAVPKRSTKESGDSVRVQIEFTL